LRRPRAFVEGVENAKGITEAKIVKLGHIGGCGQAAQL